MVPNTEIKLAFYGDDITGSTDAMEALIMGGVPTVLFLEPPSLLQIREKFHHIQAVGLAGMSRTMTPVEMEAYLPDAFMSLRKVGAPIIHYKVCSTFDSSPAIGNIGSAIKIGKQVFGNRIVPVMVGAPKLNRFVVFGNHFASIGEITYRLDRHPIMSSHPITPMKESDLRLHLEKQTEMKIELLDIRQLAKSENEIESYLQRQIEHGAEIIILDTLDSTHLKKAGHLLWSLGKMSQFFVVGSSGVEFALCEQWHSENDFSYPLVFPSPGKAETIIAISGSASSHTASQIKFAIENGFIGIQMDSLRLIDEASQEAERLRLIDFAVKQILKHRSVILFSALGADDPLIAQTRIKSEKSQPGKNISEILGTQEGLILKEILERTGIKRVAVAGGDTSGYVLKQLSIYVLEFLIPLGTATPLCKASSHDPNIDGLEICLKGGQLGSIDIFQRVLNGRLD